MTEIVDLDKARKTKKDRAAKLCFTNEGHTAEDWEELDRYHATCGAARELVDFLENAVLIDRDNVARFIDKLAEAADLNTDGLWFNLSRYHLTPRPGPTSNPGIS